MIDMGAIAQEHVGKGASIFVPAMGFENDISSEDERRRRLLRSGTERMAFLRAVNPTQPYTFRMGIVQTSNVSPSRTETTGPVKSAKVSPGESECLSLVKETV